ncbi:MAG: hypothetical protein JO190_07710 [Candidatus Eremiobacteraeota bacterium]|nr:hypothetical protein [Candidatus Eremiobacteraeota bacterium]
MRTPNFAGFAFVICMGVTLAGCGSQSQVAPIPQPGTATRYSVSALTTPLGGGVAEGISNRAWAVGSSNGLGRCCSSRAVLWRDGKMTDLGTLGGPNSSEQWPVKDGRGLIAVVAETSKRDPLQENFCGFGTGLICLGAAWKNGVLRALPTLGGNNGEALGANDRGQIAGYTETAINDPTCSPPRILDFEGVVWGPKSGEERQLRTLPGDVVSGADGINDNEQIFGVSGTCSNPTRHGVLWHAGTVSDLGNLGGALNTFPWAINSAGDVVGQSDLAGDATTHAFLWTKAQGMQDLGALSGDGASLAFGANNHGQVVGGSCTTVQYSKCRAFLWQHGAMLDLNQLVCASTSLHLFFGNDINDHGEIVGYAFDRATRKYRPFLAMPHTVAKGAKTC